MITTTQQQANTQQKKTWLFLLGVCLITRILGAIFYIEDIDSLRFALAIYNYNLYDLQPHFPGYFFYFMLIKPIYWLTQSVGLSFAIMGALAIWAIIFYSYKINTLLLQQEMHQQTYLLGALLLFSPLLFLMSTRYMPDIWGLTLLVSGTYYLLHAIQYKDLKSAVIHSIIMGLECGVRLSYIPFWFPSIILVFIFFRQLPLLLLTGSLAILFWLVPMIIDTSWNRLFEVSQEHAVGHFTKWGGTVMSNDHSYFERLMAMIESIWADGLGGFWINRHWVTALWSVILISLFIKGIQWIINQRKKHVSKHIVKQHFYILGGCLLSYSIWVYFFQNIVYKPRHIMPLLPFLTMIAALGGSQLLRQLTGKFKVFIPILLSIGLFISCILGIQHKSPSSIAQIKQFIIQQSKQQPILLLSPPLMDFYFKKHSDFQNDRISCMPLNEFNLDVLKSKNPELLIFSIHNIDQLMLQNGIEKRFYHNPYVNRLWSQLSLYRYHNPTH